MKSEDVYLSLGGNIGNSKRVLQRALFQISQAPFIELIKWSNFYQTTPVSPIPQREFVNCACHIKTSFSPIKLLEELEKIEKNLGKKTKDKYSPRIIDIDIILFGTIKIDEDRLTIPHKEWKKRLFVLKPLSDLQEIFLLPISSNKAKKFNIKEFLQNFENTNNEKVSIIC
jgi:2-amino-4-hydroxy-6-hydroxymethyldihydropteridine diphosphokinase